MCVGVYSGLQWVVVKRLRLPAAQDKAQETSDWNHNCDRVAQHPLQGKKKSSRQTRVSVPTVKQVLSSLCGQLRSELRSPEGGAGSGGKSNKIALQALQSYLPKVQND